MQENVIEVNHIGYPQATRLKIKKFFNVRQKLSYTMIIDEELEQMCP
jgi:hypothetical protein